MGTIASERRGVMSGWYQAGDGTWHQSIHPPATGWWLASDGRWYPPEAAHAPQAGVTPAAGSAARSGGSGLRVAALVLVVLGVAGLMLVGTLRFLDNSTADAKRRGEQNARGFIDNLGKSPSTTTPPSAPVAPPASDPADQAVADTGLRPAVNPELINYLRCDQWLPPGVGPGAAELPGWWTCETEGRRAYVKENISPADAYLEIRRSPSYNSFDALLWRIAPSGGALYLSFSDSMKFNPNIGVNPDPPFLQLVDTDLFCGEFAVCD